MIGGGNSAGIGSANWVGGNVVTGNVATIVVVKRVNRATVQVVNLTGGTLFLGATNAVTAVNGFPLPIGASVTLTTQADVWGILATGAGTAAFTETY